MKTIIFAYTAFLLALAVSADNHQSDSSSVGTLREVTKNAATYLTKQIGEIVKTVDGVKTDFSVGNLPTKLTPGGPGSDSSLARYLANIWRSSYHSGGIWFGFEKDNGYMGFAATDAEVAKGESQYTYRPPGITGDRTYYKTDAELNALPTKFKTIPNYLTKTKPFWKATYQSGGRDCGWASQVSGTSFKPNMYYVCPMNKDGNTVAVSLEGRDIGVFSTKLATFSTDASKRVLYFLDKGEDKELRGVSDGSDVVKQATNDNGDFLQKYNFVKGKDADTSAIKETYDKANGTVINGWTVYRTDMKIGKNMKMELVIVDKNGCTDCAEVTKSVSCELSGLLQPFVDDLHGMQKDVEAGVVPVEDFPNFAPAVGSRWREYLSAVWRDSYRLGGIWMGFEDNGYIGFAASAKDYKTGASQSVFIPPVNYLCNNTLPTPPCTTDCAPVVEGRCRRFFELNANNDLKPARVYRQINQENTVGKGWYAEAKTNGRFWYIMRATTIGLPAAYLSQPMTDKDGQFRGVLIHQFGIGGGSPFSNSLKAFIGDRSSLDVYVVRQSDGALLATGGTDKDYYDMVNKKVVLAKNFVANKAISETANAQEGKFEVGGSYTTGDYAYEVVPLDGEATANTGWSVIAVRARKSSESGPTGSDSGSGGSAIDSKAKKKDDGLDGGWIAFIVLICLLILFIGYQLFSGNEASDALPTKKFKQHIELGNTNV